MQVDMKKFIKEFQKFAIKGNVMDMAVGVIIGAAFKDIVDSLVSDIFAPLLGIFGNDEINDLSKLFFRLGVAEIHYGKFIASIIHFLLMALIIFIFIRLMNRMLKAANIDTLNKKAKTCPHCKTEIHKEALRCPNCTSELRPDEVT